MADRFEQWSRAKLGSYELMGDSPSGPPEYWVSVLVPVDSKRHDPRRDVIAALTGAPPSPAFTGVVHIPEDVTVGERHVLGGDDAEKPPTARHRKTRGK